MALTTVIQSIFGVAVLHIGNPILVLPDYEFISALTILRPISIAIHSFQILRRPLYIDRKFIGIS